MKRISRQQLFDAALVGLLLAIAALFINTAHELARSRDREAELFVLANRLDVASLRYEEDAQRWRSGALSCFGRLRDYRAIFDDTKTMIPDPPPAVSP